jgi:hypothetical protein
MSPTDVILNGGKAAVRDRTSAEILDVVYGNEYYSAPLRVTFVTVP